MAVPAVITAPAAHAATDVTATFTTDDARIGVRISGDPLWVKASIMSSTGPDATVLASTDALTWQAGDNDTGRPYGHVSDTAPRLPDGTPYGTYPVVVEYRQPGGTAQRWTGGTYVHKLHAGVSGLAFDRKTTSLAERKVVLSGRATTWDPVTGATAPALPGTGVDVTLQLVAEGWKTLTVKATTGEDGAFSLPFSPNAEVRGGTAVVVAPNADTVATLPAAVPEVGVEKTSYRLTADLNKYRVQAGTNVTVTGRVERLTPDGWKPYAGAPLITTSGKPESASLGVSGLMGSGAAAADGSFSYPARASHTTQVYTSLAPSVYYASRAYDQGAIAVPQQFAWGGVRVALDEYGTVRATGKVSANTFVCWDQYVFLQASLDNGRTWRNLANGKAEGGTEGGCPFDISARAYHNAMYRLYHYETDQLVGKVTGTIRLSRIPTRFSAFTISPSRPRVNAKMTVSGTLQQYTSGAWRPLKGAKVMLVFKPKGYSEWYWVTRDVATGSNGSFSFRATNYGDGTWAMVKQSASGYFHSETKVKYIDAL
ncbi:hypothetical protein AB0424_22230 [Streptomyces sp. NPDC051180]|uniref:hypothetical protein n=1 Tax=Streptomyces sp. NPDC051180 TaxID=3155797 RepID=UPI00344BFEDB